MCSYDNFQKTIHDKNNEAPLTIQYPTAALKNCVYPCGEQRRAIVSHRGLSFGPQAYRGQKSSIHNKKSFGRQNDRLVEYLL